MRHLCQIYNNIGLCRPKIPYLKNSNVKRAVRKGLFHMGLFPLQEPYDMGLFPLQEPYDMGLFPLQKPYEKKH